MATLAQVDDWDVPHVAAAVFSSTGVHEARGDIERTFPLTSVSKVIAAIAVHVAVEEGSLGLDDPAGPPGSTVRHLLSHASGLPTEGDATPLASPGTRRIYSNVGFELLGEHVASATGMPFDRYVHLALVEPLDLGDTDVGGSPAHGYSSSARDIGHLMTALVSGRILADETLRAMTSPSFGELAGVLPGYGRQDPNPWGLGVEVRDDKHPHWTAPENDPATWGHFGRAGTFVWFDPVATVGLVVLTDRDFDQWAIDAWPPLATAVLHEFATPEPP